MLDIEQVRHFRGMSKMGHFLLLEKLLLQARATLVAPPHLLQLHFIMLAHELRYT